MLYISLKEATKYCNYSQDYLKLRAWQGKLKAIKIGRNWVTTKEWLRDYLAKTLDMRRPNRSRMSNKAVLTSLILCLLIIGGIFAFHFYGGGMKYSVDTFKDYFYWMEKQTAFLKLEKIIPARVIEIEIK